LRVRGRFAGGASVGVGASPVDAGGAVAGSDGAGAVSGATAVTEGSADGAGARSFTGARDGAPRRRAAFGDGAAGAAAGFAGPVRSVAALSAWARVHLNR
jgi:hypothetical protein